MIYVHLANLALLHAARDNSILLHVIVVSLRVRARSNSRVKDKKVLLLLSLMEHSTDI